MKRRGTIYSVHIFSSNFSLRVEAHFILEIINKASVLLSRASAALDWWGVKSTSSSRVSFFLLMFLSFRRLIFFFIYFVLLTSSLFFRLRGARRVERSSYSHQSQELEEKLGAQLWWTGWKLCAKCSLFFIFFLSLSAPICNVYSV
jgi:hypothetical protein